MRSRSLAMPFAAVATVAMLSGCGISVSSADDPLSQARITYCAELGAQMMDMMQVANGGPAPIPSRVAETLQDMTANGTKIRGLDSSAPALDTDVATAFDGQSDQATAGAALTEMHQYCIKNNLDPMATPGQ